MKEFEDLGMLNINSSLYKTRLSKKFLGRKPYKKPDPKIIMSFIPGTVIEIFVKEGQELKSGDDLLILDAMKMQNKMKCADNCTVKKIFVGKGDRVAKGTVLIEME